MVGVVSIPEFSQLQVDHLKSPVWVYDTARYGVYWANRAALQLWESECLEELKSRDFKPGTSRAVQETLLAYLEEFRHGAVIDRWWQISPKKVDKKVLCRFSGVELEPGRLAMLVEAQDSELLHGNENDNHGTAMVALFDEAGQLVSCNPPFSAKFAENFDNFEQQFGTDMEAILQRHTGEGGWDRILNSAIGRRWHNIEIKWQQQKNGDKPHYIVSLVDIHERKLKELQHATASFTDPLTGLLNRRGIEDRLSTFEQSHFTVFYIDLDDFKPINDTYGHRAGDALLKHIAKVLRQDIDPEAISSRLGGDEFLLIVPRFLDESSLHKLSKRLMQLLSQAVDIDDQWQLSVSASVGIAQAPRDGRKLNDLLVCADAAMYAAKHHGRSRSIRYVRGMEEHFHRRTVIVQDLEQAADSNQLQLMYQNIVSEQQRQPHSLEAFLRWQHPQLGAISPEELALAAQETGHISTLETWVLKQVGNDLPRLIEQYGLGIQVSVNLSLGFLNSGDFIQRLQSLLCNHSCLQDHLILEVGEEAFAHLLEVDNDVLDELQGLGATISIDGFGGGFSCLPYLENVDIAYIKLHPSFIRVDYNNGTTLSFIAQLCKALGVDLVATGVEEEAQRQLLLNNNIVLQQGFYYSQPLPIEALLKTVMEP